MRRDIRSLVLRWLVTLVVVAATLAGCGRDGPGKSPTTDLAPAEDRTGTTTGTTSVTVDLPETDTTTSAPSPATAKAPSVRVPMPRTAGMNAISAAEPPPRGAVIVSPSGSPKGVATESRPLDLATALSAESPVKPGGTILLRGGRYRGTFESELRGTPEQPIIVRSYPGEWAVIDGGTTVGSVLDVRGADIWFKDLEVMKTDPERRSRYATNTPPDISRTRYAGISVVAPRARLINLVVHDNGDGIGLWRGAVDSVIYGCLIFNNGWVGKDHSWGHGIYVQNDIGTKSLEDNVLFNNFGMGVHAYAAYGPVDGIETKGLTSFENGAPASTRHANVLVGAERATTDRISISESILYHREGVEGINMFAGYPERPRPTAPRGSLALADNAIVGGSRALIATSWRSTASEGNLVLARPEQKGSTVRLVEWRPRDGVLVGKNNAIAWDRNAYRMPNGTSGDAPFRVIANGNDRSMSFDRWKSTTGFDGSTRYDTGSASGLRVSVRTNRYERGRALVTILNWNRSRTVTVDLSKADLKPGEAFEIRDVQNLAAPPVVSGVYAAAPVKIPMTSDSVMAPVGMAAGLEHTTSEFGSFIVLRAAQSRALAAGLAGSP